MSHVLLKTYIRAFVDDLYILTPFVPQTKSPVRCAIALDLAGMKFRLDISCLIVIVKGRCMNSSPFKPSNTVIPSIQTVPVKFLGRIIDDSIWQKSHCRARLKITEWSHLD